ncbi:MAG: FAD-dependent oxidoreductase [Bacteroidetes bacterium]|nr:FAD-dependent oxidoreductase [Bacteroidota bacterium]
MKPTKTPAFFLLRKVFFLADKANQHNMTGEEVVQRAEDARLSRRRFLQNTGKALLVTSAAPAFSVSSFGKQTSPRIAIVGGGMAGLSALHTLKKAGLEATVYEASGRTGGRIFTVKNAMGEGTWTEFGGEFIDTQHEDMHRLKDEFGLELMDTGAASEQKLIKEAFFFEGKHYSMAQVVEAFKGIAEKIKTDLESLPEDLSYHSTDPVLVKFDRMTMTQYLEQIGTTGWIKNLLEAAYEAEYGLSPQEMSSLNLITFISTDTTGGSLELFGESDERYKVRGGNQSIPDAIAAKYPANIQTNRSLEFIKKTWRGFCLKFSGMKAEVKADYVIMTIPFSKLRQVDLRVPMPEVKKRCIETLGFGTNSKVMMGFKNHHWRSLGYLGFTYSDNGIHTGWDNAQLQNGDAQTAGYSILLGGAAGVAVGEKTPQYQKDVYLPKVEQVFKGVAAQFNGKAAVMHWPSQPHTLGSYICYKAGQFTSIAGAEAEPVGRLLFAGEHCGGEFGGFMNGAAMSGRLAAEEILKRVE